MTGAAVVGSGRRGARLEKAIVVVVGLALGTSLLWLSVPRMMAGFAMIPGDQIKARYIKQNQRNNQHCDRDEYVTCHGLLIPFTIFDICLHHLSPKSIKPYSKQERLPKPKSLITELGPLHRVSLMEEVMCAIKDSEWRLPSRCTKQVLP